MCWICNTSFHVLMMACEQSRWTDPLIIYSFSHDFLFHIITMFITLAAFTSANCTWVCIRQILQPAGTPPFLRNLVGSPVRSELEQEHHWHYTVERNDSNTQNGNFRYFDAPFSKNRLPACEKCCSRCLCKWKAWSNLGKRGEMRGLL